MKKVIIVLLKIIGSVFLLFGGVYILFKSMTIDSLEDKLLLVNQSWNEVIKLQNENLELLNDLLDNIEGSTQYSDSLKIELVELRTDTTIDNECNSDLIYEQYLLNKHMLLFLNNYSKRDSSISAKDNKYIKQVKDNVDNLNKKVEVYNELVDEYNLYRSNLLFFLVARSSEFGYKNLFKIQYGVENKDPKEVLRERREWQRKLEEEYGLGDLEVVLETD